MHSESAERIHRASLALLELPGVRIEHPQVYELLRRRGAGAGGDAEALTIPAQMVEEALALCPRDFALRGARGQSIHLAATAPPHYWSCPGMNFDDRGCNRRFTAQDMAATARLLDRLEQVSVVFGMALDDVPPAARDAAGLAIMARNTAKHIRVLCFSPQGADRLVAMRQVLGDPARFSIGFTAHGPLRWTHLALEIFRRTAGHGIAVSINGEPMAGVSGPVTLAGAAAVGNAEILAGIVVNQALEPGRPCIYNLGLAHIFDMKSAIAVTGAPENHLLADISAAMGRFYGLPSASWVSTESMAADGQASLEKMAGFMTHTLSGVTCIWGVGQLESELTFSPTQAVLDNEMIGYARRYARGCTVSDDALATEVVRQVGIAGSFLEHEHTLEHFRQEFFMPTLLYRGRRSGWEENGRRRLEQRAEEAARTLMHEPVDCGLDPQQQRELQRIADDFVAQAR